MSKITLNCPNCGAPVEFAWASSVQAVCVYCKSILVRTDVDVKKVGEVGDLPNDASRFRSAPRVFTKISGSSSPGASSTNMRTADGTSGTSSSTTAQADGSLTRNLNTPSQPSFKIPAPFPVLTRSISANNSVGAICSMSHIAYASTLQRCGRTTSFQYWDKEDCFFADLRATAGRFGTMIAAKKTAGLYRRGARLHRAEAENLPRV